MPTPLAPAVSLTAPASGATVSGTMTVTATASDNVGVAGVQFLLDGVNLGAEDTAAPYSVSWDTRDGAQRQSHPDGASRATPPAIPRRRRRSSSRSRTPTRRRRRCRSTAPANGATVTGTVTVSATASDNVGVAGVQFLLDGVNLGAEDTSSPYSVSWNTATATIGTHTLTARRARRGRATRRPPRRSR